MELVMSVLLRVVASRVSPANMRISNPTPPDKLQCEFGSRSLRGMGPSTDPSRTGYGGVGLALATNRNSWASVSVSQI